VPIRGPLIAPVLRPRIGASVLSAAREIDTRPVQERGLGDAALTLIVMRGIVMASGAHAGSLVPPRRKRALLAWLRAGTYASAFTPEPGPHPSTSAPGPYVRTWYSPVLTEDLRAGRSTFSACVPAAIGAASTICSPRFGRKGGGIHISVIVEPAGAR